MKQRKSFLLILDPALYEELEGWAEQELRSVNGQIEFLLKQAILHRKRSLANAEQPPPQAGSTESQPA